MTFGGILKNLLHDTGKTQQELATFIGYSQRAVSKWINNQSEPTEQAIVDCSRFFGVTTDYLLGLEDEACGRMVSSVAATAPVISEEERELLDNFRRLSPYLKGVALDSVRAMVGGNSGGSLQNKA